MHCLSSCLQGMVPHGQVTIKYSWNESYHIFLPMVLCWELLLNILFMSFLISVCWGPFNSRGTSLYPKPNTKERDTEGRNKSGELQWPGRREKHAHVHCSLLRAQDARPAFMIGGTCIAVDCFSEELCQAVKARPTIYDPQIAFIRRRELQRPNPTPNPSLSRKGRYYATITRYRKNFRPAELKNLTGQDPGWI